MDQGGTAVRLRPPRERLDARAVGWWRTQWLVALLVLAGIPALLGLLIEPARFWLLLAAAVLGGPCLIGGLVFPSWWFRVHRWEVTDEAVYVRTGAFWQEWRIAPMSRIQTVDTLRGPLERYFGLATLTVTTASSQGPVKIVGLGHETAAELAERLTLITRATAGDAT